MFFLLIYIRLVLVCLCCFDIIVEKFSANLTFYNVAMIFLTLYIISEVLIVVLFQCQPSGKMICDGGDRILRSNCVMRQNLDVL